MKQNKNFKKELREQCSTKFSEILLTKFNLAQQVATSWKAKL